LSPRHARRRITPAAATLPGVSAFATALALFLVFFLAPSRASAYPSSVVYAPSADALRFGRFSVGLYGGLGVNPSPTHLSSIWGGFDMGILPSVPLADTPGGKLSTGGAEIGFDVFGPDLDGNPTVVLNAKLQLLKEGDYWPSVAVGGFQLSTDSRRGAFLGYFVFSKSFEVHKVELGQLTFGMAASFARIGLLAPRCYETGADCVFRGSDPFLDKNGAFIAGYVSPYFGPVSFAIDHIGGTSAVSSTNIALNVRLLKTEAGTSIIAGVGGFLANDRRASPPGPGVEDGLFLEVTFVSGLNSLFGWDPTGEFGTSKEPQKVQPQSRGREDPFDAPLLVPPTPTPTPQ
jgi:hypothetical protein